MALQIRRGTNAERLSITPLDGELIFTTDTKEVFVGDGITQGGKPVTAFNAEDAQDFVAPMFTNGTHTGITFTYNDNNNTINAVATGVSDLNGLSDVVISQPISTGQVLKYNGTTWVNGTDLSGTGIQNVLEDTTPQLGGNLDLNGQDITRQGSIVIDSTDYSLNTSAIKLVSNQIVVNNDYLDINYPVAAGSVTIRHNVDRPTQHYIINCVTDGSASAGVFTRTSRSTLETPTAVQPGDALSFTNIQHAYDGTSYVLSSGIGNFIDQEATVSSGAVPGKIVIATYADGVTPEGITVNSKGWVSINKIGSAIGATLDINGFAKLAVLSAAPSSPTDGMVAIANGTSWNPTGTGKQTIVVRLGGSWVQMAVAP